MSTYIPEEKQHTLNLTILYKDIFHKKCMGFKDEVMEMNFAPVNGSGDFKPFLNV